MRALALSLLVVTGWPVAAAAGTRVVLMPITNLSRHGAAAVDASRQLALRLPVAGYDVVMGEPVERILAQRRVRYLESLSPELIDTLLADFDAKAIIFTTILEYGEAAPAAALSARLVVAGGRTAASAVAGLTPDDTAGVLGIGRVRTSGALLERVVERVVATLPRGARESDEDPSAHERLRTGKVVTFRARSLEKGKTSRVCLLPLRNATPDRVGARVVSDLLTVRMRGLGMLQAVAPAELRGALLSEGIHSLYNLDPDRMRKLGNRIGTSLFLQGTLREYTAAPATVELELSLVDVEKGRIVWTSYRRAQASEYRHLLDVGALSSTALLADQVVAEMLEALSRA